MPSAAPIESKAWSSFEAATLDIEHRSKTRMVNDTSLLYKGLEPDCRISDVLQARMIEARIVGQKRGLRCHKHVIKFVICSKIIVDYFIFTPTFLLFSLSQSLRF